MTATPEHNGIVARFGGGIEAQSWRILRKVVGMLPFEYLLRFTWAAGLGAV
jgi:hypothetical protein